ncbi:16S rRNA (cytidine(1402)-2'-O)-methyltransferase [Mollicutes bacterium LVI A0039]|nr:16S rRNA (cytidine(1402)-2'-O)-methyltransferase [Mollicutes bacterium LVI A0039]
MQIQKSYIDNKTTLYIIPTPIGNLDDMTFRSVKILQELEFLFCEDTRVTQKLLNHFEITIKTATYHEHNQEYAGTKIIELLNNGHSVGLVSDAGMPGISDPGYDIIRLAQDHNFNIVVLPGASAFIVALVRSNFASKQFTYFGFLNKQPSKRSSELEVILNTYHPTVVYESPHKLVKTLKQIYEYAPTTKVLVAREISKKFEEYTSGTAEEVYDHYNNNGVKGECVIIVSPELQCEEINDPIAVYTKLVTSDNYTKKEAIKSVAKQMGVNKNKIYQLVLESEQSE